MIGCLGPMVGTVVVAVIPPGPSAQMAIAEAAGPCPEDTAFCRERNPPMPARGDNGPTLKKKSKKALPQVFSACAAFFLSQSVAAPHTPPPTAFLRPLEPI